MRTARQNISVYFGFGFAFVAFVGCPNKWMDVLMLSFSIVTETLQQTVTFWVIILNKIHSRKCICILLLYYS